MNTRVVMRLSVIIALLTAIGLSVQCSMESPYLEAIEEKITQDQQGDTPLLQGDIALVYEADSMEYFSYGAAFSFPAPVLIGSTSSACTFRIENRGNAPLVISSINLNDGSNFELSGVAPATLAPDEWTEFNIIFHPTESGTISAVVDIHSDDPDEGVFHFNVNAEGLTPLPEISAWQSITEYLSGGPAYTFGTLPATVTGSAVSFTIKNEGAANLTVTSLALTNTGDFSLVSPPATPFTIAPSGTRAVSIVFSPDATGTRIGALNISSNDDDEAIFALNLTGTATTRETISVNSTTPASGASDVRIDNDIKIVFDRDIDPATTAGITIKKNTTSYPFAQSWNSSTNTLTLNPTADLPAQSTITVTLPATITGFNYELFSQYAFSFTTGTTWHDGNTIFVAITGSAAGDGTKANPAKSIQAGLDLAQVRGFTSVYVGSGTYTKTNGGLDNNGTNTLLINRSITIKGGWNSTFTAQGDRTLTILDALNASDHTVNIDLSSATTAMNILLENFTVQGGYADGTYPHSQGGGVTMNGPIDTYADDIAITLQDVLIKNNHAAGGGGGISMGSKMNYYLYDTRVEGNTASSWGNGISAGGYGITYLQSVQVVGNTGDGGGMYIMSAGTKTLTQCYFQNNTGTYTDCLYIGKSNATYSISNCSFYAVSKPALSISGTGAISMTIANNQFGGDFGNTSAAISESSDISGHTITGNNFLVSYYGALYMEGSTVTVPDTAAGLTILNTAGHTAHDAATASGNTIH